MSSHLRSLWVFIPFFIAPCLFSNTPVFENWYGEGYLDCGYETVEVPGGGYLITGYRGFDNYNDIYLVRVDAAGNVLWSKLYGGEFWDNGFTIAPASNGNFLVGGRRFLTSSTTSGEPCLMEVTPDGSVQWDADFGSSDKDGCMSVVQTSDGGCLFTGQYNYADIWVLKTDASGNEIWSETFGPGGGNGVMEASDGSCYATGTSTDLGGELFLVKLDPASGSTRWISTAGDAVGKDCGRGLCESHDGGVIVAGFTDSFGAGGYDAYVVEFSPEGEILNSRTYGSSENDLAYSIARLPDGYILAGKSNSSGAGDYDGYLVRLDRNLDVLWTETYGGSAADSFNDVFVDTAGNLVCTGSTSSFGIEGDVYFVVVEDAGVREVPIAARALHAP